MAAKPIPAHKALRNLEQQYGEKCKKLDEVLAREAKLLQENTDLKDQVEQLRKMVHLCPATK
jgi:regulator of replication initiation timing